MAPDLARDLGIAERAVQRHLGEIAGRAGALELVVEEAPDLGLDPGAGRRQRAAALLLLAEALDDREQEARLAAEIALDQLLVDARGLRHLAGGRGVVAALGENLHAGREQRLPWSPPCRAAVPPPRAGTAPRAVLLSIPA